MYCTRVTFGARNIGPGGMVDTLQTVALLAEAARRLTDANDLAGAALAILAPRLSGVWTAVAIEDVREVSLHVSGAAPAALDGQTLLQAPTTYAAQVAPSLGDVKLAEWLRRHGVPASYAIAMAGRECYVGRLLVGPTRRGEPLPADEAQLVYTAAMVLGVGLAHRLDQRLVAASTEQLQLRVEELDAALLMATGQLRRLQSLVCAHPTLPAAQVYVMAGQLDQQRGLAERLAESTATAPIVAPAPMPAPGVQPGTAPGVAPAAPAAERKASATPAPLAFTARQMEVVRLLAAGRHDAEIATALAITVDTVRHHVGTIFGQLGVHSRAAAVAELYQRGLVPQAPQGPEALPGNGADVRAV